MKVLAWVVALAFVLWTVMFSPLTAPHVPFWWMMTGSAITLSLLATFLSLVARHALEFWATRVGRGDSRWAMVCLFRG